MEPASTGLVPFRAFADEHAGLDAAAFARRVTDWHLLVWTTLDDSDSSSFATIIAAAPPHVPKGRTPYAVAALKKRPGANPFALMITVGRAQNNDIVLTHRSVSKFHAYLRRLGDRWLLSDAGSTNGTSVDGVPLARDRSVPLESGARVLLGGDVDLELVSPADLHAHL